MTGKAKQKGISIIKVYVNDQLLTSMAFEAEKMRFRRGGLPTKIEKPHGFVNDWVANTDGISKYLKYCHKYYLEHESDRLAKLAEISRKEKELAEEKKKHGAM